MTDENERLRIELEDAIEKVKELQLQRNDFLEQRKISKQRLDKLQRHNEDLLKKNEFNQNGKKRTTVSSMQCRDSQKCKVELPMQWMRRRHQ